MQWRDDIVPFIVPLREHHINLRLLFVPFQEHAHAWQRIYHIILFFALGRFDNILETKINAILWTVALLFFVVVLSRKIAFSFWPLLVCASAALVLPFGYETTADATNVHVYFYTGGLILSGWLFAKGRFWLAVLVSLANNYNLVGAFVVPMSYGGLLILERLRGAPWEELKKLPLLVVICAVSFLIKGHFAQNDYTVASSPEVFLDRLLRYAGWPTYYSPFLILFSLLPMVALIWNWFKAGGGFIDRFLIVAWFTMLSQAAMLSYSRAGTDSGMVSRYQDEFVPMLLINCAAICALFERRCKQAAAVAGAYLVSVIVGLMSLSSFTLSVGFPWYAHQARALDANEEAAYLTKNPAILEHIPIPYSPYADVSNNVTPAALQEFCNILRDARYTGIVPQFETLKTQIELGL